MFPGVLPGLGGVLLAPGRFRPPMSSLPKTATTSMPRIAHVAFVLPARPAAADLAVAPVLLELRDAGRPGRIRDDRGRVLPALRRLAVDPRRGHARDEIARERADLLEHLPQDVHLARRHPDGHLRDGLGNSHDVLRVVDSLDISAIKKSEILLRVAVDQRGERRRPVNVEETFVPLFELVLDVLPQVVALLGVADVLVADVAFLPPEDRPQAAASGGDTP